ncbi:hypothetical protein Bbelb_128110 [Branchiostoma belcheri]|nr:hypothetical protein Bbelb_128110 [Branchiostoma belcheri]
MASREGKNERVKIPPRKTRHVRFGAYGKLRLYLTMFLCAVGPVCVPVQLFLENLSAILCTCTCTCPGGFACVFLRDLPPTCIYETREHRTLTVNADLETGLQQEEEPDFVGRTA